MTETSRRPRALIIDGSESIRTMLCALVGRLGCDVEMADGCASAAPLLETSQFDVILAEVHLADGKIVDDLRARRPDLLSRTIVLTSAPPQELRHHDLNGIAALLTKPFELDDLMAMIGRVGGSRATFAAEDAFSVLVVDDDPAFTYTMKRSFETLGANVTAMTSAQQAIAALASGTFDLVVVDLVLNDVAGTEILNEAARLAPAMLRVAVTGADDASAQLTGGIAHAVYRKPVNFPRLANELAATARRR